MKFLLIVLTSLSCLDAYPQSRNDSLVIGINLNLGDPTIGINVFRCYLSNFCLHYQDGTGYFVANSHHLIDLENPDSWRLVFNGIPEGEIDSISFLLGTDSLINVSGAFDGDLDPINGMYWTWNSGYINIKLEGYRIYDHERIVYEFHIGGYAGEQATAREVWIGGPKGNEPVTLFFDLDVFLDSIDLNETNMLMSPGSKAVELADKFAKCVHE